MQYRIIAKFLGTYLPEKKTKIGDCTIYKSHDQFYLDDDRPVIPVRSKGLEFHGLEKSVKNYIYYPQELISLRTFESEYLISTEVKMRSEYDALKIAGERFSDVASVLSLVAKNKVIIWPNKKRIKRGDEVYDFEIIGIFLKKGKQLVRLKLPAPLVNGRNFFPKPLPKGFLSKAKKYHDLRDGVYQKGLVYFQRATAMRYSGIFNQLEIILNFVKCIELICWQVGKSDRFSLSKKKFKELGTKKAIELAGKRIGVSQKAMKIAKDSWDARNKGDIAHQDLYFNPYSRKSTNTLINFDILEETASTFLRKYHDFIIKNPNSFHIVNYGLIRKYSKN